jgi:polynucleotide 5'-kinase involved in rRNA processing
MLTKKFESMYTDALNMDEQEEKRIENVVEKEDARVQQVKHHEHLTSKGIFEKYEEKQFIKAIQGPFYGLTSKDGCIEDDYVNSNMQDLIDYANAEVLRILVLGKPRSGKSTLASKL